MIPLSFYGDLTPGAPQKRPHFHRSQPDSASRNALAAWEQKSQEIGR